ncbi:ABC transporter substrate-binding protein [Anoxybacillus sp.]|uniref:ABC transporter substrate-binding protein n=1 Tax=Anoxybacillus sp. TaxID=1872573 RepID=UPI002638C1E2|nr:ABC transporter substrate-binding protein [uncultured Anoxybacillus sp.]
MNRLLNVCCTLAVTLLLVLAGCGKTEQTSSEPKEETKKTRIVEHFMGTTEVPMNPEKVVVLSHVSWEGSLVSVGVKPYAVMAYDNEFPPHLKDELKGVKALPYADEFSPEQIIDLDPDLLIISDRYKPLYDQLADTIPTVVIEVGGDWKEDHLKITEAVGKLEEGKKVIAELEKEAKEIGKRIKEKVGNETFMAVAIGKKDIRVFGTKNHATNALLFDDLGLTPAEGLPEDFGENISIEGLAKYNPDHIIDITYFNSGEFYDTVTQGKVWNSLKAVKNNHVYKLTTTWGFWDPIERKKGLQEIEKLLVSQ